MFRFDTFNDVESRKRMAALARWRQIYAVVFYAIPVFLVFVPAITFADRVTNGQQVLYTFDEGSGDLVRDVGGTGAPLDLTISTPDAVQWVPGGLVVNGTALISSTVAATKVSQSVQASNELTIEAWVTPANVTQGGPARIVTLSSGSSRRNFTLGQGLSGNNPSDLYDVRLRTTSTSRNGRPSLSTSEGTLTTNLTHVVFTRDVSGRSVLYLDGAPQVIETSDGDLSAWDAGYSLAVANETSGSRPWMGELRLVAIYDRALSAAEIDQNYVTGSESAADQEDSAVPQLSGFDRVSDTIWDETAVRKVLHTFAYGGQATDSQILQWANMRPDLAIVEMLTFDEHNLLLSPVGPQDYDRLDTRAGTLRGVGDFWASSDPDNGVDPLSRWVYDITSVGGIPSRVWLQAATSRGLNPFRQKIGFWETNHHLAVNRDVVRKHQIIRYYDDIMSALARGEPYQDVLTIAATSAAVASQYGHRLSEYVNGIVCRRCNEDFAREYYQLFFGILGETDPDYHELTTIKNTAVALTGMSDVVNGGIEDVLIFGTDRHFPDPLEMLQVTIGGSNTLERISQVSQYAIAEPESLNNLPVMIIGGLADDNLDADKITRIRSAWASMPQKNLLDFLRAYTISTLFHDPGRVKYLSSIDRNILIMNQMTLVNEANYLGVYSPEIYEEEDVEVFRPRHNVFGGQTGREAADSADVFRANYNTVTELAQRLSRTGLVSSGRVWEKDWAAAVPLNGNSVYTVSDVAEWLWNRFLGDGLKHFGPLERAHVYALLATELDFAYLADPQNPERIITTAEVQASPLVDLVGDLANRELPLNSADGAQRVAANRRVGQAVNFIVGTPFIYAEEGR